MCGCYRCVQKQSYSQLRCHKSCPVTESSRRACRACRWAACIRAGTAQGDYDGRRQPTASPMLTAIMSGGVGISCLNIGSLYIICQHNSLTPLEAACSNLILQLALLTKLSVFLFQVKSELIIVPRIFWSSTVLRGSPFSVMLVVNCLFVLQV